MYTPLLASAASIAFLVVACGVAWFFPSLFFVPCGFSSTTRVSPNGGDGSENASFVVSLFYF